MQVLVRRYGNLIELSSAGGPLPADLDALLCAQLSYAHKRYVHSSERSQTGGSAVEVTRKALFDRDEKGRLCTCAGFLRRVQRVLKESGCEAAYQDKTPPARLEALRSDMDNVRRHFQFRPRQDEALQAILSHRSGVVEAPTGFGKMVLLTMVCLALPEAKIDVTTDSVSVVENLEEFLARHVKVGRVGGGACKTGERVTVYTADSLHRSPCDADIVLVDEAHELMADQAASRLQRYRFARMFGFTASPEGRFDGSDVRMEALFGETIFQLSYQEAVKLGLVVPIMVDWRDPPIPRPSYVPTHDTEKKRRLIWANEARNKAVAEVARSFADDEQVLVLVDKVEHAIHLGACLPGWALVYGDREDKEMDSYHKRGLVGERAGMNKAKRRAIRDAFLKGDIKKVIATGVWSRGVDFPELQVLIRADADTSRISSIQMPGRVSRITKLIDKQVGLLVDFRDSFEPSLSRRADQRRGHYAKMGWEQVSWPSSL
ncbi:MAG: hypothetical protein E6G97_18610 [Alphaproteobacteria bacterium]|nr:MAG: hypothetical protein E6G97_18610 [Alphaproteobacteria bacterium]